MMSVQELEAEISCTKSDPVEINVGKLDVGWGWYDRKESFYEYGEYNIC